MATAIGLDGALYESNSKGVNVFIPYNGNERKPYGLEPEEKVDGNGVKHATGWYNVPRTHGWVYGKAVINGRTVTIQCTTDASNEEMEELFKAGEAQGLKVHEPRYRKARERKSNRITLADLTGVPNPIGEFGFASK